MGLRKHIQLDNGVQVNYHRIAAITHRVNGETLVLARSYTSQAKRREEGEGEVYVEERWFPLPYDDSLTVAEAYARLKELPEFEGAEDALEGE